MSTPTSHCGCFLADGCWGSGGWHFRSMTMNDLPKTLREFQNEHGNWIPVSSEALEALKRTYLGKPLAFERCAAFWGSRDRARGTTHSIAGEGRNE